MKTLCALPLLLAACLPAAAALRINEVHANPPGTDAAGAVGYEYIEIISTSGGVESTDDYWVLLMDTDGNNMGRVDGAWNLTGLATGTNGLLLLGIDFAATNGGPWAGRTAPGTAFGSIAIPPDKDGLIEPNRAWSILLVKNFGGTVGVTDISSAETTLNTGIKNNLHDAVGLNERLSGVDPRNPPTPIANMNQSGYSAGNVSRMAGNFTANSAPAWFGGEISGSTGTSVSFHPTRRFGTDPNPVATPGAPNVAPVLADLRINEVGLNPPGSDGNNEFIELIKVGGGATTGQGYHLLVVNTDSNSDATCGSDRSLGVIVEAWALDEVEFGANGLALIGQDYDDGLSPWRDHTDAATILSDIGSSADPDEIKLGNSDIGNEIWAREAGVCGLDRTNEGFTLLLVKGFSGSPLQDLDLNDDGILDATPWEELKDSVGFDGGGATYATADLTQSGYLPDNISRKAGDTAANSAAAFYGGSHPGENGLNIAFGTHFFGGFRGHATPGRANLSAAPATAPLLVSEVNFAPATAAAEFIEIASAGDKIAPTQGNSLLIVSTAAANRGQVLQAYDLNGYSTGPNGLLLLGENFATQAGAIFPAGTVRADTAVESGPVGFTAGSLPNQDIAVLLVTGFSGSAGMDLDANNDGVIDAGIGFTITNGIALGPLAHPAVSVVNPPTQPGNLSQVGSNSGEWYGGASGSGLAYAPGTTFGPFTGAVTPGQRNHAAQPRPLALLINEANINPPGADQNYDFVELISPAIDSQSANDLTLIAIDTSAGEDGLGNIGEISRVWNLDSLATGRNGLLLLGDGYDSGGPFAAVKSLPTATADPVGMGQDALASNDGIALLLVRGFTGKLGQDLDATNDDVLDSTPWTEVVDAIAFGNASYGFPNLSQGSYRPDNLSRGGRVADLVPNSSAAWYGGGILGTTGDSTAFDPSKRFDNTGAVVEPAGTPGRHNLGGFLDDAVDDDQDGLANLLELGFGSNPGLVSSAARPVSSVMQISGQNYLALSFSRQKGGTGSPGDYTANGLRYRVQASPDLTTWGSASLVQVSAADNGDGLTETIVVRLSEASIAPNAKRFLRLNLTRL
ncbi:hypothetical protein OJ996_03360 [Luteolibacter sp. GHJ8]|uniref:Uncharacterized protein n=1 Tax=Luteolibacter rhizosphaerae TaxID=2989719 RepID=A0ABT3FYF4_9BACT|nr:hypothetical protein [Luteolibacter rhizosphaerae]MCW1912597.1 hypothetical protein [Luteolibacter rhizosphaerae]